MKSSIQRTMDRTRSRLGVDGALLVQTIVLRATRFRAVETSPIKETTIKDMMLKMYQRDFNETDDNSGTIQKVNEYAYCVEDKRFLQVINEQAKLQDSHNVLPIPFRASSVTMPNNRVQAVNRANSLKKKFIKNTKLLEKDQDFFRFVWWPGGRR